MANFFTKFFERRSADNVVIGQDESAGLGLVSLLKAQNDISGRNLSSVFRATSLISNSLASLPIRLYKTNPDGSRVLYKEHPVYQLLSTKPSKFMSASTFIKQIAMDVMMRGNGYALIHRDNVGMVQEIEYIPNHKVTIYKKSNAEGRLVGIQYAINGRKRMYEDSEVLHFTLHLDEDGIKGESVIQYALKSLRLATLNEKSAENSFESGGRLSGILSVQGALTSKQKTEMSEAWTRSVGGDKSGGIAVLSGVQKYEPVAQNNSELQLLDSRIYSIAEIGRFFDLNPILLYDLSHQTYSSAEQAHQQLLSDTLSSYIYRFESELENKLLNPAELENCEIVFDTKQFLRCDSKAQAELYRSYFNLGVMSANEIRAELGMNPVADGDEHYIQSQYVTLKNSLTLADKKLDNQLKPNDETEADKEESESDDK